VQRGLSRRAPGLVGALLAGALLAGAVHPAHAQEPDDGKAEDEAKAAEERRAEEEAKTAQAEANAKGVKLTFRLGVRFLQTAPFSKTYQNVLSAYGYGSMSAILEGAADAAISPWTWLDLGVHGGYAFGSAGSAGAAGSLLTLHEAEVGGFVYGIFGRRDRRRPGSIGAGVEGGAMFPFLLLRGQATTASLPYVAPVVLLRLPGSSTVQTAIHVRYLIANWSDAFGAVGLPLGGFSISIGANLSL
jgi:hypothetical protein